MHGQPHVRCSYRVNREVFLRGFRRVIVFSMGPLFMLIVEDMEGICRLWVVIFYVTRVLFVTLL